MPIVIVTQPSDGQTADANDVNSQIDAILAVLNGNLDSANYAPLSVTNADLAGGITVDKLAGSSIAGWAPLGHAPSSVVANGNKSYNVVFSGVDLTSVLSPGMRLQLTRSTAAPHQCATLNGSSQYFSNASPNGMTFTDKFVVSAWVKMTAYQAGTIVSRYNGTSGWALSVTVNGTLQLIGLNGSSSNYSQVASYQSLPLNKWVHVAAQLDMTDFTATTTTSYTMIDGVDVPASVTRGGSNPTALIQAGSLEIGAQNGASSFFPGEVAQVAIYSAQVTQSTILASINQTLVGTETSLISAYTLSNSLTDLNANANTLTANGSAVATTADSPFAQGATAGLLEYGIVMTTVFSTNTTIVVQVPEGSAIPTSGGVSTVNYSASKVPYLFPSQKRKWHLTTIIKADVTASGSPSANTWYNAAKITAPVGEWSVLNKIIVQGGKSSNPPSEVKSTLSTANNSESDNNMTVWTYLTALTAVTFDGVWNHTQVGELTLPSQTPMYLNLATTSSGQNALVLHGEVPSIIRLENSYL